MISGRFFIPLLLLLTLNLLPSTGHAFWGWGEQGDKSGLNFDQGYDLNTVTSIRGTALSIETGEGGGPVIVVIRQGAETIRAITAPPWFWSDRGIAIRPKDELMVQGAKAQGKDGAMYIISRTVRNITTGDSTTLRSESGHPVWKGGQGSGQGGGRGMQRRYGGGRGR